MCIDCLVDDLGFPRVYQTGYARIALHTHILGAGFLLLHSTANSNFLVRKFGVAFQEILYSNADIINTYDFGCNIHTTMWNICVYDVEV